jgi:membrane-associated phospholipid phosphatase
MTTLQTDLPPAPLAVAHLPQCGIRRTWWLRAAFVACGLAAWFWTQSLIGHRAPQADGIGDAIHRWTAPLHDYLFHHPAAANALLITSSAVIDAVAIFLLAASIFGPSVRPFLAVLMLFALRQICQGLCALPPPHEMIWHNPGVPTLLVTYGVSTDLFFSGHTGLAVLGAIELTRLNKKWLSILGICIALGEAATVLVLRAHYTMDVFTGAVTAMLVASLAAKIAPRLDARLGAAVGASKRNRPVAWAARP